MYRSGITVKKKQKPVDSVGLKTVDAGNTKKRRKTSAKVKKTVTGESKIKQYIHEKEKRANNPPVGLVTPESDQDLPAKKYSFDPHLDPQLQWSGKAENSDFEVDTVSLHRHERIDPMTIIGKVLKKQDSKQQTLFPFFEKPENILPLRDAIEFYKHDLNWSNRLITGDSLLVMNSLLEKEGMEGKVQMIYIDPPYGIKYGSNFQPFVNKRDVKDGKDEDLTQEPEMINAFRDTWELGIHSYLTYLRNRLLLARQLLHESGSCFVQISDTNLHHVREIMDEVFGSENFVSLITFQKTGGLISTGIVHTIDYICWYSKDKSKCKIRQLYLPRKVGDTSLDRYDLAFSTTDKLRRLTSEELLTGRIKNDEKRCRLVALESANPSFPFEYQGVIYNQRWKTNIEGLKRLVSVNRIISTKNKLNYLRFADDFPVIPLTDRWESILIGVGLVYVVQTSPIVIQRCLLMTTDPGDIILDPTCGSGTTVFVAEQWGRRWITCDTSRIAITLTKQRLITARYNYYKLKNPEEGITSGFICQEVPHISLKSIVNDEPPPTETLYDKPETDRTKIRITGPFTVEAVPSPIVKSIDTLSEEYIESTQDTIQNKASVQQEWRDELLRAGIRGKGGQKIEFSRVETHSTTKWLHVDAETKEEQPKRVMVSFGPEHAALEQRQVAKAIAEAQTLVPKPSMIIFAAMQFDPEAAKDIDELNWPGVTILKAEMNKDLQTRDLKKKQSSNESFWLMGSPDVDLKKQKDGKYIVTVNGFDYYDTKIDEIRSGGPEKIAMWILDTDYDDRSVYPQQVFFPMDGKSGGWNKLAKTLQAYIDEDLITKYQGIESIPFNAGLNKKVAVKIIDDRGIESLKIIDIE